MADGTFTKTMDGEFTEELMRYPKAFVLLLHIAQRARRAVCFDQPGMLAGQCLIGKHDANRTCGLTEKEYIIA